MRFSSRQRALFFREQLDREQKLRRELELATNIGLSAQASSAGGFLGPADARIASLSLALTDLTKQMAGALPEVVMAVNPKSARFKQPKRFTRQDTLTGTVFHHFTNDKGQNNDILTISFAGNTGNISRIGKVGAELERSEYKILAFHNLYQLTREPMLLSDGSKNEFYVDYLSSMLPFNIRFYGFWSAVMDWEESATKPNSRDYTMEFIVQSVSPDLDTLVPAILAYLQKSQPVDAVPADEARIITG